MRILLESASGKDAIEHFSNSIHPGVLGSSKKIET